jgi:hypothetical protein
MSKLLLGNINLSKIDKAKLVKGKKGIYLDVTIWINDEPDQYGRDASIQHSTKKGEATIYIGDAKFFSTEKPSAPEPDDEDLPF